MVIDGIYGSQEKSLTRKNQFNFRSLEEFSKINKTKHVQTASVMMEIKSPV